MTEEKEIEEYKDLLSEKILSYFPNTNLEPAEQIDNLLEKEGFAETLRISQIDIIDILSQPTLASIDVANLIEEYGLQQNKTRPRRTPKDIEERLKPYGISNLLWKPYHDDHYDAFDFPLVPKRSLSIPLDNGLSGAWAPNGYGKTFVFDHILKYLQDYQPKNIKNHEDREHELFSDFLTKCTARLHHSNNSTIPHPYDGQREEKPVGRLIPFRQICFSVQALEGRHTTEFFSVRIEIEYDYKGNASNYSLQLLAPNVANSVVVEGNIKLPNWINSNYHLDQISYTDLTTRGRNYSKWPGIALRKLLSLNVNYIEIPSLAYQPNAWEFIQENIKAIVKTLLDEFTKEDYPDIQIDEYGLFATFKGGGNRFLLDALNDLNNNLGQEEDEQTPPIPGTGIYALNTLITNIQIIQSEINALVSNDDEAWGITLKILTPLYEKALDIINPSTADRDFLQWRLLSFGQRNDLIFQTTLAQYQHCYNTSNTEEQVVLVIDEPEVGRSESWVNQLMHKLSTHTPTHPILILSHRGMVLESINSSGEYQIMHTVKPEIDEVDEETYKDYGVLQSNFSTKAKQSFALINAFVDHPAPQEQMSRWRVNFPQTITPSEEWMETKAVENQWILKPTNITESEYINIKQFVNQVEGNYVLSNQELLLELWNGRIWPSSTTLEFMLQLWPMNITPIFADSHETSVLGMPYGHELPPIPKLNFLLKHLPIKPTKNRNINYKPIKALAQKNGLEINNKLISNVRNTIARAEQHKATDSFLNNLHMFIAGLKVRLDTFMPGNADPLSKKAALQTYILQLENQLTNNPLITQLESQDEINARQPATGPNQQFTEQGFFGYLKTLGVKMPEQTTQENPTSTTDFEETTLTDLTANHDEKFFNQIKKLKSSGVDIIITDPPYKTDKTSMDKYVKKLSEHESKFLTTSKTFSFPDADQYQMVQAKIALRLRDKAKHPTQADFDTTKYRWTQKTLIASITEAEINDYAEEFVLHLASRYADENDLDPDEKIWIRADAFKKAAREIADRDVSSRIYDDFDDECGQYMLIRADIHGYSCLTCESMYDEKKFLI